MKRWGRRGLAVLGAVLLGTSVGGARSAGLVAGEIGAVRSVLDGDTLYMDDGLKVRLSGMQAPKLPLGRKGFKAWPLGEESRAALIALTKGRDVQLYYGGEQRDRYDRALAQVYLLNPQGERDLWVQEEMIRLGMARVYTWPDTHQETATLYAAEREARAAGRGIWGHDYYAVRKPDPDPLAQDIDSFQLVEGFVVTAADVRGTTYLNFGASYKTDFTIAIARKNKKLFEQAGLNIETLEGARVRVRGWVELQNGPIIWLDHPQRLEVLD